MLKWHFFNSITGSLATGKFSMVSTQIDAVAGWAAGIVEDLRKWVDACATREGRDMSASEKRGVVRSLAVEIESGR